MKIMIKRYTHVGHIVRDMDKGIDLYTNMFGFRPLSKDVVQIPGGKALMVAIGDNSIELIEPTDAEHRVGKYLATRGEGLFHISFRVDNIDAEVQALRKEGINIEDPREISSLPSRPRIAFVDPRSALGAIIELAEEH